MASFLEETGQQAMLDMTNFTENEFLAIWNHIKSHMELKYNTGRGGKTGITGKDMVFMTLAVLKHGAKWDLMAYTFGMKAPTFEKRVTKMIRLLSPYLYKRFVMLYAEKYSMSRLHGDKTVFRNFKMCKYAVDVTFQQSFRPGGSLEEAKKFFSGKHKLYGFKVEVSVLPNGLAANTTRHYPGSVADIEICRKNMGFHLDALEKNIEEKAVVDISHGSTEYPDLWGALFDKGYIGIQTELRAVMPKKSRKGAC